MPGVSELIPPTSDQTTLPFDVPACPGSSDDAVLATAQYCEAQPSEFAPPATVPARSAANRLPPVPAPRRQPGARLQPVVQQPHSARSAAWRRGRRHQDHADAERHARPAGAVRDHDQQTRSASTSTTLRSSIASRPASTMSRDRHVSTMSQRNPRSSVAN